MTPSERLRHALATGDVHVPGAARAELLAAFVDAQVLAAVTATSTGEQMVPATGLRAESGAELAVLLIAQSDGGRALPVFLDPADLRRWRLDARPVPLLGSQACAAAREDGARHVVIDPGGAAVVLEPEELRDLGEGWVPVPGSTLASRRTASSVPLAAPAAAPDPALLRGLQAVLAGEGLVAARLLEGPEGLVLGVHARPVLDPAALAALAHRIVRSLGPDLPDGGVQLMQVPARGPGQPIGLPRWSGRMRRRLSG